MKARIFSLLFLVTLGCFPLRAQHTLTTLYTGWFLHENEEERPRMDRMIFSLNWLNATALPAGVKLKPYSWGASLTRVFDIPFNRHVGIGFGVGFNWRNLHHNGDFITEIKTDNTNYTHWEAFPAARDYRVNKITLTYLDGLFQLRMRFGKKYGFRFYPGFKGGYLINDYKKYKDEDSKIKVYNTPNLLGYYYGPHAMITWGNWAFTGHYSLTGMFKTGKGDPVTLYSLGISYLFI